MANHHWYPRCVIKHWKDNQGFVHKLSSNGSDDKYKKPEKIAYIADAHSIKFKENECTDWDESFESYFDFTDNNKGFKHIISWLKTLENGSEIKRDEQENLDILLECILSLVVRSPSFRNSISKVGQITTDELCVKLNQRDTLKKFKESLFQENKSEPFRLARGKFAVLFSSEHEFIFGDGFYHNFISSIGIPSEPRIIIPLLPNICICYYRPIQYKQNPHLIAKELTKDDVDFINQTTMCYSRDFIFYRSQKPVINENFSCKIFLEYESDSDPVINAFSQIFK